MQRFKKATLLASTVMVSAMLAAPAYAQDVATDSAQATAEPETGAILVTGSRIAIDSATALASPVQVVTIEQFKKAVDKDDNYAVAHYNLGEALFQSGNVPAAKKEYDKLQRMGAKNLALQLDLVSGGAVRR